ncbi:3-ketodihydrosphingosine reductase [Orussus abietinus]|uniref:3-ketodihydrosphingosine reductase n=1 Tax=Orussus abietinus TaxID=222816 RepID=UPI0006261FAA|nr:3-ketodihydrosphingosine reductase [Orussus abietinus]
MDYIGVVLISFVGLIAILLIKQFFLRGRLKSVENKHVVITGGSSGIGKCVALSVARRGAHVTIIARDIRKLEAAKSEIIRACKNKDTQKVECLSLDIRENYDHIEKSLHYLENTIGPIYMLVNCAGTAICGKIEDTTIDSLTHMVNLNLMGTYYCTKAIVPKMKSAKEGIIVITSSLAALVGLYGYSAYSCTKFALRGLAESVAMELAPYGVSVTLSVPPDTDTPGFAVEELSKPVETQLITQSSNPYKPELIAEQLIDDALEGKFFSTVGFEGFMLTTLCAGMSPLSSISEMILQVMLSGLLKIIGTCYQVYFRMVIENCKQKREKEKKFE